MLVLVLVPGWLTQKEKKEEEEEGQSCGFLFPVFLFPPLLISCLFGPPLTAAFVKSVQRG